MNKEKIIEALDMGNIEWRKHALERMLERDINRNEVKMTLRYGEIIENYIVFLYRFKTYSCGGKFG